MKTYILPLLAILLFFANCKTDDSISDCADVNCFNGGLCNDGICICPEGFYGEYCEFSISGPCDTLVCLNSGICQDGWCYECSDCYEGQFCEIDGRAKFLNNYNGFLSGNFGSPITIEYNLAFTKHADNLCRVVITDNLGNTYFGVLQSNSNNITIPQQSITFEGENSIIEGSFTLNTQNGQQLFGNISFVDGLYFNYEGLSEEK